MRGDTRRFFFILASLVLYFSACFAPALLLKAGSTTSGQWTQDGYETLTGAQLLLTGIFGLLMFNFAWLANPLLAIACFFLGLKIYRVALWASIAALMFSLATFQLLRQPYMFDEAGVREGYLQSPQLGFFLWIASMAVVCFASLRFGRARRKGQPA